MSGCPEKRTLSSNLSKKNNFIKEQNQVENQVNQVMK